MFIENYRLENMVGGQALTAVPYPEISAEDWKAWQAFLPVRTKYKVNDLSKGGLVIISGFRRELHSRLWRRVAISTRSKFGAAKPL